MARIALLLITAGLALPATAAAAPSYGEARSLGAGVHGVVTAFSGSSWTPSLIANTTTGFSFMQQDRRGRWRRRFDLPAAEAWRRRVLPLEGGALMVVYDEPSAHRVMARTVRPDGAIEPPVVVLPNIATSHPGDPSDPLWQVTSDRKGTVAVVSTDRDTRAIVATVRDPGGTFAAPQQLEGADETAGVRLPWLTPVAADGSVTARWTRYAGGDPQLVQSTRPAGGAFGAVAAIEQPPNEGLSAIAHSNPKGPVEVAADHAARVRVRPDVLAVCRRQECVSPHLHTWRGGAAISFATAEFWKETYYREIWAAYRQVDGTFGRPVRISSFDESPGVRPVVFALGGRGQLAVVRRGHLLPFGTGLRDRRRPGILARVSSYGQQGVTLLVACTERCFLTVSASTARRTVKRRLLPHDAASRRTPFEPLFDGFFRYGEGLPAGTRVRLRIVARDLAGRSRIRRMTAIL